MKIDKKKINLFIKTTLKEIIRKIDKKIPVDEKDEVNDTIEVIFRKVLKRIITIDKTIFLDKNAEYNYTLKSLIFKIVRRIYTDSLALFCCFIFIVLINFVIFTKFQNLDYLIFLTSLYLSIYFVIVVDNVLRYRGLRVKKETKLKKKVAYFARGIHSIVRANRLREIRLKREEEKRQKKKQRLKEQKEKEKELYHLFYFIWVSEEQA